MQKYMVGYCSRCGEKTKHKVIECTDSVGYRIFETLVTVGFALLTSHKYHCECVKCGKINTLSK